MGEREEILGLSPTEFAPHLLGAHVSSYIDEQLVVIRITEVEAYAGAQDPGSHAYRGKTKRNAALFGPPGTAYIYFTYGMHHCANVVCGHNGIASAALMRAGEVIIGEEIVRARRSQPLTPKHLLLSGPARLAQGLGLTLELNGASYRKGVAQGPGDSLGLEHLATTPLPHSTGPRTGVAGIGGTEAYPYRYWLVGEPSVSKYRRAAPRKPRAERD
ncbi:3-methyladenine DNA glycosylase [Arthrobacter sp. MYb227]|uniref:DNA-3-methyladenine glycosylase n=1 Tax=Arthrobacter sp. MYb227 TaxID=1848601 RepID=UPI000CFAAA07|nr:DNA-3-methyladenine glycosylase [Arthrobacter sp. MYb227]PQZ92788.1 3-methyladenine DNA glycosylase [Arthrobacter sp. MYb227]